MDFRGLVVRRGRATRSAVIFSLAIALAGCGTRAAVNDTFSLASVPIVQGQASTKRQILVPEPAALQTLNNDQIVIRLSRSELQYLAKAQWGDRLPKMVQDKLVQTFDNSGKVGGVGRPGQGLAIDYQLITEIRSFEISTEGADAAVVEIFAKLLNDRDGTVRTQKAFRAVAPVQGAGSPAFVAALDAAFARVAGEIVGWTLSSI
ncbi:MULTISPECIES: ABC-type transport auxiliary lipoprotein family protein [unclassified Sinorhizobium]|uniref:ABC-type transport auxiliary lipoprotein family protein n=1 Tax=unclassified Sinorhizobium TaxID=2613772 RepID=UPI0024C34F2B|nr:MULTISPECIES: ABC-type transport auxiliary lipoprotein family protein [unclassified Sinorhizobium]MDK1373102.1 ABC-type transport auxiliary lipoprotein family protein [Sinorhizobium sp. 6-70]MDK1479823.1 ABC-type transport auxiliary lipoprotein family protein [Sinorhizobium sp. 6-117]